MVGGGVFNLPSDMSKAASPGAVLVGWLVSGIGMLMLAFVYQGLATRKPELNTGLYADACEGRFRIVRGLQQRLGILDQRVSRQRRLRRREQSTLAASRKSRRHDAHKRRGISIECHGEVLPHLMGRNSFCGKEPGFNLEKVKPNDDARAASSY
jgi:hypothetical protein